MDLQSFDGAWPLSFSSSCTQSVGLPVRGISPSHGRHLHTGQHKHRINAHKDAWLEWSRTHDLSVWVGEEFPVLPGRPLRSAQDSQCLASNPYEMNLNYRILKVMAHNVNYSVLALSYKKNYELSEMRKGGVGDSLCKIIRFENRPDIDCTGFPRILHAKRGILSYKICIN
jgi:hypothetical protein